MPQSEKAPPRAAGWEAMWALASPLRVRPGGFLEGSKQFYTTEILAEGRAHRDA